MNREGVSIVTGEQQPSRSGGENPAIITGTERPRRTERSDATNGGSSEGFRGLSAAGVGSHRGAVRVRRVGAPQMTGEDHGGFRGAEVAFGLLKFFFGFVGCFLLPASLLY